MLGGWALGLTGDVLSKWAGPAWGWRPGVAITAYAFGGLCWWQVFQRAGLAWVGTFYPIASALGLVVVGTVFLNEPLPGRAVVGGVLGICALALMGWR